MLQKMKWRFIIAAMSAFSAVMVLLIAGINYWNYSVTTKRLDSNLQQMLNERFFEMALEPPPKEKPDAPPMDFRNVPSKESRYMMRYFSVYLDENGSVFQISREFVSSISEEDAAEYAREVWKKSQKIGFFGEYRYIKGQSEHGSRIIFLNAANEQQFLKTLLLVSCLVGMISLGIVFLLVYLFSGRAARPYIYNMEKQKQFITDASHELKTPIASVSASADVLAMEYEDNEWVKNIQKQTVRLSRLVGDLVILSRLDEANLLPNQSRFSFSDLVWEMAEAFLSRMQACGKEFVYHIEDDVFFYGDEMLIHRMVSILLDNAVKYSSPGGYVQLDFYRRHHNIVLEILNTCDIDPESDMNRLFERFYRPDQSRNSDTGGTGIGLSIAEAAVKAHKGKISVKCEKGEKICFKVVF